MLKATWSAVHIALSSSFPLVSELEHQHDDIQQQRNDIGSIYGHVGFAEAIVYPQTIAGQQNDKHTRGICRQLFSFLQ